MDNPLAELNAWWDAAAPEDGNAYTRLTEFQTSEEVYRLGFETVDDANEKASWRLEVADAEEIAWHDVWGEPEWFADHVLLFPYDAHGALIGFAKPLVDPLLAWGALAKTHRALVGDWFPLERFFNTGLLESDFGQLASGPERLLAAYTEALASVGNPLGYAPLDHSWRAKSPAPSVVTWGKSFVVARSFALTRLG